MGPRLVQTLDVHGLSSSRPQQIPFLLQHLGLGLPSFIRESGPSGTVRVVAPCLQLCHIKTNWEDADKSCLYCHQSSSPIIHARAESKGSSLLFSSVIQEEGPGSLRDDITLSYLIRAGTSETKTVRFLQSIFRISTLYLLPPKSGILPFSKGREKRQREYNSHWASSLASIMSRVAWQPALAWSFQWTSRGMNVRPPGHASCPVYGPTTQRQRWVHTVPQSWQKTANTAPAVFRGSPMGFCFSHTGQSSSNFCLQWT